jgi:hypothetical protein
MAIIAPKTGDGDQLLAVSRPQLSAKKQKQCDSITKIMTTA